MAGLQLDWCPSPRARVLGTQRCIPWDSNVCERGSLAALEPRKQFHRQPRRGWEVFGCVGP
eukprot:3306928-Pyramimonas_sp.AAC.1